MSKCAVCGAENKDTSYVLMIRRDGSEAELCPSCAELMSLLDSEETRAESLARLKNYALGCGDYEVRRFLDGVIGSCDEPESYNAYVEKSRERRDGKGEKTRRDTYRYVRTAALVLFAAVALYGIMRAVADIAAGAVLVGIADIVLTALADGALLVILSAVMDALDDVRTMRKRIK